MASVVASRSVAEESAQMWELNKRLEAYLARVKALEEENQALKGELQRLRGGPAEASWRARGDEQLAAWRARLAEAFREQQAAELGRAGLAEEARRLSGRCQKERAAREEAQRLLGLGRRELEEERRSHLWLREKAAQLEQEARALAEAHEEERALLEQEAAGFSCGPESCRGGPVALRAAEVEDYSARLAGLWRGAVETYRTGLSQLQASLGEAAERLRKASQSNQQSQLQLQSLRRELAGLKARKEALEERLAQQWQHRQGEAEKLQVAIEGLEEEKQALAVQIAQVLEDRRQLMHLKMSLSLEVATYRTLLEAESTRLQVPGDHRVAVSLPGSRLEASKTERPAVFLGSGQLGPQDPPTNATPFPKGGVTPLLPTNQSGPSVAGIVSVLPRSRSPVVREAQRADTVLPSQSAKALEGGDVPAFTDATAFQLASSRQSEVVTTSRAGRASQSFVQESPLPFSSNRPLVPNVLGAASSSPPPGEDGGEISAQMELGELGKKAELHQEVEEEEKQPTKETLWETPEHHVPYPSQLVTEALETALQEVRLGEGRSEAGLVGEAEAPNGIPSDSSSSMEEENGAGAWEEGALELHRSQVKQHLSAGRPEGVEGSEGSREANGGPEVCSEQQEEAGMGGSWDAEPSSLQGTQLLEEERSPSAQQNKERIVFGIPVAGRADCCHETRVSEQMQGGREQPPGAQSIIRRHEPEEWFKGAQSASQPDEDATAMLRADQDIPEPGMGHPEDHPGAAGPDLEETDGGAEDLEVVSTEALHLSEDEEQRALSSPSRESEEGDFQAEMLESEFLQTEEFAGETLSLGSPSFYPAGSHQQLHFLGAQQEAPEEETSLSKTDFTFLEEEAKQLDSKPETSSAGGAALREEHSAGALSSDPRTVEKGAGVEEQHVWEPQQDMLGGEDFLEEGDALGKEDTMEKKEMTTLLDWTREQQTVLQQENVGSVLRQEIATGEETVDGRQEHLPVEQQMEEEDITMKGDQGEGTVEGCQEDLPMEEQVEKEEITTKGNQGEQTVEESQGDLPVEQEMEEEDIATKGDQGEGTVEESQGDLPVEQEMEEEDITSKGKQRAEALEVCQEVFPMEQQVEEEDTTMKGDRGEETVETCQEVLSTEQQLKGDETTTEEDQGERTVEECQGDLPVGKQMEEEDTTTKGDQGEQTVDRFQEDLPVEQQTEHEDITTKKDQRQGTEEACQEVLPMQQQMEEEDIATEGDQGEGTVEGCQGDLPLVTKGDQGEETVETCQEVLLMEKQIKEEEITTKGDRGEQTVEECQGDLPVEKQMEEEDITMKGDQGEQTVGEFQEDLPVEQLREEEDIATEGDQGEQTVDEFQEDLPVEQLMEEEDVTTEGDQGEQTVEGCQDLPLEEQMEEEDTSAEGQQGEGTIEGCQEDLPLVAKGDRGEKPVETCQEILPVEHQTEEEDISMKGDQRDQTVEGCQGDLPVEKQMEEEDITMKGDQGEQTVDEFQDDLPAEQLMEEEDVATEGDQGEQTVEGCQEDLPVEQLMEEEDIPTKGDQGEQTTEGCQEDLPVEQLMEEEESKAEQTVETCQGDVSEEEQVQEEGIAPQGEQGAEPAEVCPGALAVQQQREEDGTPVASPERVRLKREDLIPESEAVEAAETESKTNLAGKAGSVSCVSTTEVQEEENPESQPVSKTDLSQTGEQPAAAESEEPCPNPESLHFELSLPHEASAGPSGVPSEAQDNTAHRLEAESCSAPPEMALSSESDHRLPSGHSGPEASPDAVCDTEGIERDLGSGRHIELEETLPDHTPLHLYDEKMLVMTRKGQPPPENEDMAEAAPLLTKGSVAPAEAVGQAVEGAECPYRPQAERDSAKAVEGVDEDRDTEAAPKQEDPFSAEGRLVPEGLEEAKAETLGLLRGHEEGLHTTEGETPGVGCSFPPWDAEAEELLNDGSGAREGLAGGEMAREEASRAGLVWETEGDGVFQPDQLGPSFLQEGFPGDRDSPLEFCEPSRVTSEGSHKVSPLTSVADLGEIVLEEEQSPDSQNDGAKSEGLANYEDASGPRSHGSPPVSDPDNCGREEPAQQTDWPGLMSRGMAFAEPPAGSWKDSDILEIVEQALEFNQEVIKAAEQTVEAETWTARGEHTGSSLPFPDAGRPQVLTETRSAPSPNGLHHRWAESNTNGLEQDPSLAGFTTEILNGIGELHSANSGSDVGSFQEEPVEEAAVSQPFRRQDLDGQSPLGTGDQDPSVQTRADEEAPGMGGVRSEIHEENASLEHRGQEKSPFASRMQPVHGRGKDAELEAASVPPRFGEEILHLEPIQNLKFRPEGGEELWSPEDD